MSLTRKHYEAVARSIAAEVTTLGQNPHWSADQQHAAKTAIRNIASNLCADFRDENPRFDGARFLKACGF